MTETTDQQTTERQGWMATLAKAPADLLEEQTLGLGPLPEFDFLRPPETGLVMVRGRAGGDGQPFNLGEMTMTRTTVKLASADDAVARVGVSYISGRDHRKATLAAIVDALLQVPEQRDRVHDRVILPLDRELARRKAQDVVDADATRVDFFTMVRGEDE